MPQENSYVFVKKHFEELKQLIQASKDISVQATPTDNTATTEAISKLDTRISNLEFPQNEEILTAMVTLSEALSKAISKLDTKISNLEFPQPNEEVLTAMGTLSESLSNSLSKLDTKIDNLEFPTPVDNTEAISKLDTKIDNLQKQQEEDRQFLSELDTKIGNLQSPQANNEEVRNALDSLRVTQKEDHIVLIALLQKITELAIAADDSPDIENAKELIKALSQNLSVVAGDLQGLKGVLTSANDIEELFAGLKEAIEASKNEIDIEAENDQQQWELTPVSLNLQLFGNAEINNGVFEITDTQWRSGFRSSVAIEQPGEYFEYRIDGKGIVGITAFPNATESWRGTQYAYYHTSDTDVAQFINSSFGNKTEIQAGQIMRLAIDEQKHLLWQTLIEEADEFTTLFRSKEALYSGVFLYGTPANKTKVYDFGMGKQLEK